MEITLTLPDNLVNQLHQLPNLGEFVGEAIKQALVKQPPTLSPPIVPLKGAKSVLREEMKNNDKRLIGPPHSEEEFAKKLQTGLFLLAYLKAELSLGEFAELMNMEYLEAREWLTHLGIPMMRQKSPELESVMQANLQKFMQRRGLNRGK